MREDEGKAWVQRFRDFSSMSPEQKAESAEYHEASCVIGEMIHDVLRQAYWAHLYRGIKVDEADLSALEEELRSLYRPQ